MDLVTGHAGTEHISSADIAALLRGLYGDTDCVLVGDDQLACTILDSNTVQIGTGGCLVQGHYARIDIAEELAVESGSVGYYRNDLVVIRYSLGASGVQSVTLAVKQGEATTGAATDPSITEGSIDGGDATAEFALWRLPISGVNIGTPERVMALSTPFLTRGSALSSDGTSIDASGTIQGATIADSVGTLEALRDSVSSIGEVVVGSVVTNAIPTNALTQIRSITLDPGVWIIISYVQWGISSNTVYGHYLDNSVSRNTMTSGGGDFVVGISQSNSRVTKASQVYQSTGSTISLSESAWLKAIRIA